jgi:hypothetical protein
MKNIFFYLKTSLFVFILSTVNVKAQLQSIYVLKEIDDDNIIIVTEKNEKYLLEKWSMRLSPLIFEGSTFLADVSPLWVTIYFDNKDPIKWSVEKFLGVYEEKQNNIQKSNSKNISKSYTGLNQKHWIKRVDNRGKLLQLEDDSFWEISPIDIIYSALWLPLSNVYVKESNNPNYEFKILNIDDGESVEAKFIGQ